MWFPPYGRPLVIIRPPPHSRSLQQSAAPRLDRRCQQLFELGHADGAVDPQVAEHWIQQVLWAAWLDGPNSSSAASSEKW
ncbi:hypothetical protein MOQ72_39355 [Saccharopolyspora sp. K220]|uniref:hypothetical protein n=1 Tax=Saccharopolyspora soli TaxID=2926618 RepID=UPI001F5A7771|nr:hypothetical protein [Saccharopolyspora soli]MCI2423486.1 hypothetical protein [Saccharopolyspora soli]